MNKSFKVVFNKARGALMVVNEVTSCVQAKGTKTVIATAVALVAGAAVAAPEISTTPDVDTTVSGWVEVPAEGVITTDKKIDWADVKADGQYHYKNNAGQSAFTTLTKEKGEFVGKLWVSASGKDADATGLEVKGEGVELTNKGEIYVTTDKEGVEWKNEAMLAEDNAKAVNANKIVVKNAYGMRVGSNAPATIENAGTIIVEEQGVGMELGGAANSKAVNYGTIVANTPSADIKGGFSHGVLIKDTSNNTFTNYGTIEAAEGKTEDGKYATAIEVQQEKGTTEGNILNFENGSKVIGDIEIEESVTGTKLNLKAGSEFDGVIRIAQEGVSDTVLNAAGFDGKLELENKSEKFTINVTDGADLELADGHGSVIETAVIENGKLSASIWQKYIADETKADNTFKNVIVKEDGIFNVTKYNAGGTTDDTHDSLLIKGSNWTLDGGVLQVAGQNHMGALKVGTASEKSSLTIESGDYSYKSLTVGREGTTNVNGGTLTVGDLTLLTRKDVSSNGSLTVGENGTLTVNGVLTAAGDFAVGKGMTVEGDLVLGGDASLALKKGALTITGEMTAAGDQIFTKEEGQDGTYVVSDQAKLIGFGANSGLLITDAFTVTDQSKFEEFLGSLDTVWTNAPAVVFTGATFEGPVTYSTSLGYNGFSTEVVAGESKDGKVSLTANKDVAVGALKVNAGTKTVAIEDQVTGEDGTEFVFAGLGGNIITGVNKVETITANGEVTLGWDEASKGVVNADLLKADSLSVAGQFKATNVEVANGAIDKFGSLTVEKLVQAADKTGDFTVGQAATLDVRRLEIETNLEQGATLVIGDRLDAPAAEGIATLATDDDKKLAQIADTVRVGGLRADGDKQVPIVDAIGTTNADGRNLLKAVAGDQYDAEKNVGLYVDNTIAVARNDNDAKLLVGSIDEQVHLKPAGSISLGSNAVMVIDVDAFSADEAVFDAGQLIVNADTKVLLKDADRIGSVKLVKNGTVDSVRFNTILGNGDTNAWLNYEVAQVQVEQGEGQAATTDVNLNIVFDKEATKDENLNAFAEKVLTTGSESLGVVNAIGTVFYDEKTKKLSDIGEEALDEYMALPAVAGTYNAAYDAAEQVWNTVGAHNIDRTAGKTNGVWADVFYSANEAGDMYGNGYGYEADVYGGVLGYDYTAACGGKIGAALTIGTSDVDAKGDFIGDYGNDADFWGLSIYASKDITEKMMVSADITYLSLDNDIKGSVAGASVDESIDSSVISVGLRADWKAYESNAFEIVPHAGIRYAQIDVDDYREMDGESLDVLEMPIGVAFNGKFEAAGIKFVPTLDFTVVPQIGDTEVHPLNGDTLDVLNNTYNTTLGISAEYGDFTFGVAAKYGFGTDDRSNAGVKVNATYAF